MARRAERGAAAGELEAGYDSDVDAEEEALLLRDQRLGAGELLQRQLEQQHEKQEVGGWLQGWSP
jgi:hypothetical protein